MKPAVDLGPVTDNWQWQVTAACRGMDVNLFYLPDSVRGQRKRAHTVSAKAICNTCPVTAECLARAIKVGEPDGVWGGLTVSERDALQDRGSIAVA